MRTFYLLDVHGISREEGFVDVPENAPQDAEWV